MRKLYGHICVLLLLLAADVLVRGQNRSMDECLDRYADQCAQCLELKERSATGEYVSKKEARSIIEVFLEMNRELKGHELRMTAAQRHRFSAIGQWFITGEKPVPELQIRSVPDSVSAKLSLHVLPHSLSCRSDRIAMPERLCPPQERTRTAIERGDIHILASMAVPEISYGVMAGYLHRRWGGYLSVRSSFTACPTSYSCTSEGVMDTGSLMWPTGNERRSSLSACAGLLAGVMPWLTIYAGAGYGQRKLAWEDVGGSWALVSDWSCKGIAAEFGAIASWNMLAFSAGISTVCFRMASFTCGVGVRF